MSPLSFLFQSLRVEVPSAHMVESERQALGIRVRVSHPGTMAEA
jgi:hypothetical protein